MTPRPRHPLAPLTAEELTHACAVVRGSRTVPDDVRFVTCTLHEPDKAVVLSWDGSPSDRLVECVVYHRATRTTTELLVSLSNAAVRSFGVVPGAQPPILDEEWVTDPINILADERIKLGLARRGITDVSQVVIDPWPAGHHGLDLDATGRRLARGVAYLAAEPGDNPYARPIENLVAVVDRDTGEVLEVHDGIEVPIPEGTGRSDAIAADERYTPAALEITQPDGPGFTIDDGALSWGPWRLRISMHPIEGLVLHDIRFIDDGRERQIMYRAALSEMVVPYGSTAMNHWWKCTFDAGEGALGKLAGTLDLGCDCLGEIQYLDAVFINEEGRPVVTERAICLHEEDHGVLWRHRDTRANTSDVRRSRRMVISFVATVGNYDYAFYWYLYLDGRIEVEVKLTGIIQTQAVAPGTRVPNANPVTAELAGPHHQHFFNFRLDMCVDGPSNSIEEIDSIAQPMGPSNPHGNAFEATRRVLERESVAQRTAAPELGRYWRVANAGSLNACGDPVGYRIELTHVGPSLLAHPDSSVARRAAFASRHLWTTAFDPSERRASGNYPNQHPGGDGLSRWVEADRPLVNADLVVWITTGVTHFCRPEDFPVMPTSSTGFSLLPFGFFDSNPSMNLAPPVGHCAPHHPV